MRSARSIVACVSSSLLVASRNQSAPANSRPNFRRFTPTRFLPKFEIHDVREDPAKGTMTRVSIDGKQLLLTQHPQVGPRKLDPNDLTPQFDSSRRISTRFRHVDLAGMVCVIEGRIPSHQMSNNAFDLTFEKTASGGYSLKGSVRRVGPDGPEKERESWGIVWEDHFALALEHFLQAGLTESFGFQSFAIHQAQFALKNDIQSRQTVQRN